MTSSGAEHDVAWLTEAIASAFNQDPPPNGLPPPRVAWAGPDFAQPSVIPQAVPPAPAPPSAPGPTATAAAAAAPAAMPAMHANARMRAEYRQWVEQWQLLLKREQLAAHDVQHGACELLANSRELKDEEASRTKSLQQLKHKLQEQLWTIRGAVDTVKLQLVQVKPGPGYVAELSREIECADQHLSHFKRWQASQATSLAEQEQQLEEEMEAAVIRIEDEIAAAARAPQQLQHTHHSNAGRPSMSPGPSRPTAHSGSAPKAVSSGYGRVGQGGSSLAPEVVEFEEFVERHGETGGWDPGDHAEFVNILKACGGDYTHAVKIVMEQCMGYSQRDIILHARWHMDYMDLLVRKRMALAAWRAKRDQQKSKAQAQAALLETETATEAQVEHKAVGSRDVEWERDQSIRREIVRSWKDRQDAARRKAAEAAAERQRVVQQQKEAERALRQQMNKEKLELHRQAKEQQEREAAERRAAHTLTCAERASLGTLSPQQAASVAVRNAEAQRRHQQLIASKEAAMRERSLRQSKMLEKVHKEGTRDPNRLLRPTTVHQRRVELTKAEEHAAKESGFILTMPHKAPAPPLYKQAAGY